MDEQKKSKTSEILEMLQEGVKNVFDSDAYKTYLRFISKFRHYSWANTMLILMQAPDTQYVASFSDWKNKHNRYIKKGSKAIRIIAPHNIKETDKDGNERISVGFHAASLFRIEDTVPMRDCNEEIPSLTHTLCGSVAQYERLRDVLIDISPVPVSFEDITSSGAYGYFSPKELKIVIQQDLPELQTCKTLMHEIAHSWLHAEGGECEKANRRERETQAESVAYAVACFLELDTGDYSFPYIAGYSSDKTFPELKASLAIIHKTANKMIDLIEERMLEHGTSEEQAAC